MLIFELVSFVEGRELTLRLRRRDGLFGELAMSYHVTPAGRAGSRLLVRICCWQPRSRRLFALGDLVMMRKQLRTLASLAARDARERAA